MAETSYIIQNGRRLNLKDSTARKTIGSCDELKTNTKHCLVHAINEIYDKCGSGGGSGPYSFEIDENGHLILVYVDGTEPPAFEIGPDGHLYLDL